MSTLSMCLELEYNFPYFCIGKMYLAFMIQKSLINNGLNFVF